MKSYRETLEFNKRSRRDYINITPQVNKALLKNGISEGLCLVNAMHITASVYINLDLGPWERIFYGEFDGRRTKRVLIKIIGE